MLFPEQLFSLPLLKDVKTQQIEHAFRSLVVSGNASPIVISPTLFRVPDDRWAVITQWCVTGIPVAASALSEVEMNASGFGTSLVAITGGFTTFSSLGLRRVIAGIGPLWVPPAHDIQQRAAYTVGDANNFTTFHLSLITFPRGNIARS